MTELGRVHFLLEQCLKIVNASGKSVVLPFLLGMALDETARIISNRSVPADHVPNVATAFDALYEHAAAAANPSVER